MANADRVSDLYHGRLHGPEAQNACRDRIHWICQQVAGQRVLDVGCSQGITTLLLAREGYTVFGIDREHTAVAAAREALRDEPEQVRQRVRFGLTDAFVAELEPASFDTVILGEVLEHLATPGDLLNLVCQWLRPSGRLVVTVPHGHEPHPDHKHVFYCQRLVELLNHRFDPHQVTTIADKYLCAVASRPADGQAPARPTPEMLHEWNLRCAESLEQTQRREHVEKLEQKDQIRQLQERGQEYRAAIERLKQADLELREELRAWHERHSELREQFQTQKRRTAQLEANLSSLRATSETRRAAVITERDRARRFAAALDAERELRKSVQAQYRQLQQRLKSEQAKSRQLQQKLKSEQAKARQASSRASRLSRQRAYQRTELDLVRSGVRYRVGDLFVRAAKSPGSAVLLPFRLVKLALEGVHRVRARRAAARREEAGPRASSAAPVAAASATGPPAPTAEPTAPAVPGGAILSGIASLLPAYAPTPADQIVRKDLKIAGVMDEFSWRAWQYEAELIPFTPNDWREVLEQRKPDLLLVESAWSGVDDSWYFQIRDMGKRGDAIKYYALPDVIQWCRERNIPTVFYNKEDPPNYDVFIDAAKAFDHVFTSDSNCIPNYRKQVGHERVYALPFAAQPRIHNPVLTVDRTGSVCFAGTWYAHRHFARQDDAEKILRPALEFGLHIFDRMANSKNENYRWPEVFLPAVRGALPYAEMIEAYKRYKVFININSVTNSPTMFSRRVFELLASGTPVVSAYSDGIDNLLGGDIVPMARDESETRAALERVLHDEEYRARLALRGLRRVFSGHTYTHRLEYVLEKVGMKVPPAGRPRLTVIAPVATAGQLAAAWDNFNRQSYDNKRLIVCTTEAVAVGGLEQVTGGASGVTAVVVEKTLWGQVLQAAVDKIETGRVVALNPNDYYGPHYLADIAHATLFVGKAAIGKAALFQADNGSPPKLVDAGREYRYVSELCPWTLCVPLTAAVESTGKLASAQSPYEWWNRLMRAQDRLYAGDRFSYVRQGNGHPTDWPRLATSREFAGSTARVMEPALV